MASRLLIVNGRILLDANNHLSIVNGRVVNETGGVGDVNIAATTQALILAEQVATITLDVNVDSTTQALILTEQTAAVALNVDISATTQSLVLSEQQATVILDVDVGTATQALILSEQTASVALDISISATTQALVLTAFDATVVGAADKNVLATTQALVLSGKQATITNIYTGTLIDGEHRLDSNKTFLYWNGSDYFTIHDNQIDVLTDILEVNTDYTTTDSKTLICTNSSAITITLNPNPVQGESLIIKRTNGPVTLSSVNNIDGNPTLVILTQYDSPRLVFTTQTSEWSII